MLIYGRNTTSPIGDIFLRIRYEVRANSLKYQASNTERTLLRTLNLIRTGRPIDAILLPVAPHAAVIPGRFYHYSKDQMTFFPRLFTVD